MSYGTVYRLRDVVDAWDQDVDQSGTRDGPYESVVRIVNVRLSSGQTARLGVPEWLPERVKSIPQEYVYLIQRGSDGPIKIGRSVDPLQRLESLQTGSHERLELRAVLPTDDAPALERSLHKRFSKFRLEGEWFRPTVELYSFVKAIKDMESPLTSEGSEP